MVPKTFESKPKEFPPFIFAGININITNTEHFTEQDYYAENVEHVKCQARFEALRAMRHKLACLTKTRHEMLAGVNILSQVTQDILTQESVKNTSVVCHLTDSPGEVLMIRKLDLDSTNIIVYADGSFAGNNDA